MNGRKTWLWLFVAAGLFGMIIWLRQFPHSPPSQPAKVLPNFTAAAVTSLQVRPAGQSVIRVLRTNNAWQLAEPLVGPAQSVSVESLLAALEKLTPSAYITARERQDRANADEEDGLAPPHVVITLQQGAGSPPIQLWVGAKTAPGDQVFLQVIGVAEGVYVVDADLLRFLPHNANDWRDTTFLPWKGMPWDRLCVTNGTTIFCLQRESTNRPWRMIHPIPARANQVRIEESLQTLQAMRIQKFVSDDSRMDLEAFGLQPPDFELALARGSNTLTVLQFGKSPTNDSKHVFARRLGQNTVVTVPKDLLGLWRGSVNDFRDPHLLMLTQPVEGIEVRGEESFLLQRQTNQAWRVLPQNYPADPFLVKDLLGALGTLQVAEFVKDSVVEPDLPVYGLATPFRQYILSASAGAAGAATNNLLAELSFGTNQADKVFVRRADESFVYAVKLADFQRLPGRACQFRQRHVWSLSTNGVAGITIRHQGKIRQLLRKGPHEWSLAPGSQGIIEDLGVEGTMRGLVELTATAWLARGEAHRAEYGLAEDGYQLTLDLANGDKPTVQFGKVPFAAVKLDGELWILEFPWLLYRDVTNYLSVPGAL